MQENGDELPEAGGQAPALPPEPPPPPPPPLVRYRKADNRRRQQLDTLHSEVADKVSEVIESFRIAPSRTELIEYELMKKHPHRKRKIVIKKRPLLHWVMAGMGFLGVLLLLWGWLGR